MIEHRYQVAFGPQFPMIRHGEAVGFVPNLLDQPQSFGVAGQNQRFTDVFAEDMFKLLGVNEVRLLTNNPKKVEILTEAGINIVERVPLIVGRNPNNEHYLDTKAEKMGHLLNK